MAKTKKTAKGGSKLGVFWGALLGLGAPLGCLVLRLLVIRAVSPQIVREEIQGRLSFYLYIAVATPIVFASFGFYLGRLRDRLAEQNTYLARMNLILERQSMIDEVTGLANRRYLEFEIDREIERAKRYRHPIAGLMMDIDDFKSINDRYGHLAGDLVLAQVASVLRQSLRKVDIAGRYGGDEFIVILPEANPDAARMVAVRIQKNIRACKIETAPHLSPLVSIGLFGFTDCSLLDKHLFIERVDLALLKAKRAGKDRIVSG